MNIINGDCYNLNEYILTFLNLSFSRQPILPATPHRLLLLVLHSAQHRLQISPTYLSPHLVNIDLAKNDIRICCKENESIFQIAYNFLSNPFFQVH